MQSLKRKWTDINIDDFQLMSYKYFEEETAFVRIFSESLFHRFPKTVELSEKSGEDCRIYLIPTAAFLKQESFCKVDITERNIHFMSKIIKIAPLAAKEDKLKQISEYLEELKHELGEVMEEYEEEEADSSKLDALTEALDALEDAYDAIEDIVAEEL